MTPPRPGATLVGLLIGLAACSTSHVTTTDAGSDAAPVRDAGLYCWGLPWRPGPLPPPAWLDAGPSTACTLRPRHDSPEFYDDCDNNSRSGQPTYPECGISLSGAAICVSYWTQICQTDDDCPWNMICARRSSIIGTEDVTVGFCEKACDPEGGHDQCYRCDFDCTPDGYCDEIACRADCDCPEQLRCIDGLCYRADDRPRSGICGTPDADCPCTNGSCVPSRGGGCCLSPFGEPATLSSDPLCGN